MASAASSEHFQDGHGDDAHQGRVRDSGARLASSRDLVLDTHRRGGGGRGRARTNSASTWFAQAPRYGMTPSSSPRRSSQSGQVRCRSSVRSVARKALAIVLEAGDGRPIGRGTRWTLVRVNSLRRTPSRRGRRGRRCRSPPMQSAVDDDRGQRRRPSQRTPASPTEAGHRLSPVSEHPASADGWRRFRR